MKEQIKLCAISDCTGCMACQAVCVHHAIEMVTDDYGFKYPQIDENKCIGCKACTYRCPVLNLPSFKYPITAAACFTINQDERKKSSSGGLATCIAKKIIQSNGIVYGCAFLAPLKIKHIRCSTIEDIEKLRGSKYVQSDVEGTYKKMRQDLKNKLTILFIGTPCEVAAVKSLFPQVPNLYTVDIICHGTPSLQFLQETLPNNIKEKSLAMQIEFRTNTKFHFSLKNQKGTLLYERPLSNDMYMKAFFNGTTFRPSCFKCHFAQKKRISDITLGDFWGLKSTIIKDAKKGVSLALINTTKGEELFNKCLKDIFVEKRPLEEAFIGNEQLNYPFQKKFRTSIFRCLYPKLGYNKALCCALPDKVLAMKITYLKNKILKKQSNENKNNNMP